MKTTIVSDTSSLIILTKLEHLRLLENLFEKVFIPNRVAQELATKEDGIHQTIISNPLFKIVQCRNIELLELLDDILDYGESEALVLAKERQLVLLIDEKKGRKTAKNMGIKIIGFLGILLLNYRHSRLSKEEIEDILNHANRLNFRLSEKLKQDFFAKL